MERCENEGTWQRTSTEFTLCGIRFSLAPTFCMHAATATFLFTTVRPAQLCILGKETECDLV